MAEPRRLCYVFPPCEDRVGKFSGAGHFLPSTHHIIGCCWECPYITRIWGNIGAPNIMSGTERKCCIGPVQILIFKSWVSLSLLLFVGGPVWLRPWSHSETQTDSGSKLFSSSWIFILLNPQMRKWNSLDFGNEKKTQKPPCSCL